MIETAGPAPGYADKPEHFVEFEPSPKRIRVTFGGETIVDTTNGLILYERGHVPVYYLPRADAAMGLLAKTDHSTHCPFKGDASYYTVNAGGKTAENAVWSYELPFDEAAGIGGYLAFYWREMDHWFEDIVWHYPDPVHESARIKDYLCFFNEQVDAVYVDGVAEEKPKTKWS